MSERAEAGSGLSELAELLREEGGLMAELLPSSPAPPGDPGSPAALAASGPRALGRRGEEELLIEAIYEGYLLHYGEPRLLSSSDPDLGLLAGDRLYALGLARLVEIGDTFAVAELADTISLSALAQGAGAPALAEEVWTAGARTVGWGPSEAPKRAKELVVAGAPDAIEAMRTSARDASRTH
jgi:hypothetical protein